MARRWDQQTKEQAIRLVLEHRSEYPSQWAAIEAVSGRLGMAPETLRKWLYQYRVNAGERPGITTDQAAEIRALKRKNAELERTIEILKAATTFFARASDPQQR